MDVQGRARARAARGEGRDGIRRAIHPGLLVVAVLVATGLGTARDTWAQAGWGTMPDMLSAPQSTGGSIFAPRVDVDMAGNAVALWSEPGPTPFGTGSTVRAARFDAATRRWSSPQTLSGATRSATAIDIAVDAAGPGAPTGTLLVRSGTNTDPSALRVVSVAGDAVTLAWAAPAAGLVPTTYLLEGGVAPGQTLASVPLGTAATLVTLAAPAGTFYLRIVAVSGSIRGGTTNEIRVVVGVPGPPSSPTGLLGLVNGSDLALSWTNTFNGGAPTTLMLTVTGSVTGSAPVPVGESFSFANVPPGSYTFKVAAVNAAGSSAPSAPVTLTFPGACDGAPNRPPAFSTSVTGNVVTLAWEPPQSGPAVTGYVLVVTGAFTGTVPVTGRVLSGPLGGGLYDIAVAGTNACGTGPATPPQTVVVP